ncbi:MAG TPA: 1-(5-phosphoribosyl)-5-[(5-phosphoribosylamino)methylideneamino]imidazole-4-carboxamide isomerase [Verrucomicrobiae bacterium]|nr:1-(5-phosphoribosyl)-5-[(5-phosphoribosylamino)methylideneamino]imidazole-4-carboxamide isomerase [Verrucomicrobiae bacterium]
MSRSFLVYPAIDLKGGKVVRLRQGRVDAETIYSDSPVAIAKRFEEDGARFLHVVDLEGAFEGGPRNWDSVRAILKAVQIPVQLGGGLRTLAHIEDAMRMGVTRVVVGTKACESPAFVEALASDFGVHIAVGIDARDGFVSVKGWVERTELSAIDFAQQVNRLGVQHIIFTDIATDGTLAGPNYHAIRAVCTAVNCFVIASGGVSSLADVHRLQRIAEECSNLTGVIIGKALYDGRIDLKQMES